MIPCLRGLKSGAQERRGASLCLLTNPFLFSGVVREEHRTMGQVKDLVCGMMIDPETAAATSEYRGQTYYFCARGCKVAFDRDPEKCIQAEGETRHST